MAKGRRLQEAEIRAIERLLRSTDMSIREIAERTGRCRATVISVNRRYQVRDYGGQRSTWRLHQT